MISATNDRQTKTDLIIETLKKRPEFIRVREGARAHEKAFVIQLLHRQVGGEMKTAPFRVGFTVTKKTGNAVERNRIKRRLRAAISLETLPVALSGHDAVLIARREALTMPFDTLVDGIAKGLELGLKKLQKSAVANAAPSRQKRRNKGKRSKQG